MSQGASQTPKGQQERSGVRLGVRLGVSRVHTHVVYEFSLQEADRLEGQEVVEQEGVGVLQGSDDTPGGGASSM